MKESLEEKMNQIKVPTTLHTRCMMGVNCAKKEREENQMNKKRLFRTVLATAAVAGVCILTTGNTAIGNTVKGFFKDVVGWNGAVVGTEYLQATEEIKIDVVQATVENGSTQLCLEVTFTEKEQIPWKYIEEMALGSYKILDEEGKEVVIVENEEAEGVKGTIVNGKTQIIFEIEQLVENTEYTMVIESMYGLKKADAPLKITGNWEYNFKVQ